MRNKYFSKGFTLIELLVVISIIALLSSIVLASLNTAREKAKTSAFEQNMKQLQLALEVYKSDTGMYPLEDLTDSSTSAYSLSFLNDYPQFDPVFVPDYISQIPETPNGGILYYNDMLSINLGVQGYKCGTEVPDGGYLIYIVLNLDNFSSSLSIPKFFDTNGIQYGGVDGGIPYGVWCLI
jgi:type II secretion system protein G